MGRLHEDDVVAGDRAEQPDVPLTVREAAWMPLEGHLDKACGELARNPAGEGDGGGATDDLHRDNQASYEVGLFESSDPRGVRISSEARHHGCEIRGLRPRL